MICPHCKKPIKWEKEEEVRKEVIELHKKGYSLRDIERLMTDKGLQVSFATAGRIIRKFKELEE